MAKALGITISINKKSREERSQKPTALFAEDYNRLRNAALRYFPDLESLMPPEVETYAGGANTRWSHQSYAEIDAFAEQIYQLLLEQTDS
jgi:hypothetical protein